MGRPASPAAEEMKPGDLKTSSKVVTAESARRFIKRATYKRINGRRASLILGKNPAHLTADEASELAALQAEVGRIVNLAYPWPRLSGEVLELIAAKGKRS